MLADPPLVTIPEIQGASSASPFDGQQVRTIGVITGDFQDGGLGAHGDLDGFYLQAQQGDGVRATSDGIFVFEGSSPVVNLQQGDLVEVMGTVDEYFGETQLNALLGTVTVLQSGAALPAAAQLVLPVRASVQNSDGELIADLEAFEGMLVTLQQSLVVIELFNLDRFGEILLVDGDSEFRFAQTLMSDGTGDAGQPEPVARRQLLLDDGLTVQNPDPVRYAAPGDSTPGDSTPGVASGSGVRIGDTVHGLIGNIRFSRGSGGAGEESFRLEPVAEPAFGINGSESLISHTP